MRQFFANKDYDGLRNALSANPDLANEGIPYDEANTTKAHPLHRLCDAVFAGQCTDEEAIEMARILLEYGAKIDGDGLIYKKDTPLIAASSLHADKLAVFYIENGANIFHRGTHGGTALHWAAWCGRPFVVARLIKEGAEINKLCIDFESTPLFWAVHGLKEGDKADLQNHLECVRLLIQAGGDKSVPNANGKSIYDLAEAGDLELKDIIN